MLLNEILNKKIEYEVDEESEDAFMTSALIGGRMIEFYADKFDDGKWTLSFGEAKGGKVTTELTGSGSELEVFSMVKDSIVEFVKKYKPTIMSFTAAKNDKSDIKNNRGDLYDRLIKKFKIPGYKASRYQGDHTDSFALEKD